MMYIPSQCAICKAWPSHAICHECVAAFGQPQARCRVCARLSLAPLCSDCIQSPTASGDSGDSGDSGASAAFGALDACWAALNYAWPWSPLISQFKFFSQPAWARSFASIMRSTPFAQDAIDQAHLLLPIPLSAARLAERGFNQSLLLALQLSPSKTQSHLLLRTRHTQAQSQLNRQARLSNLLGAFAMSPLEAGAVRGQHILLIDDVMTSGATLNLVAQVLKQAGAQKVSALVLAKTPD